MSLLDKVSLILTPNAVKQNKLYSIIPSNGNGDMSFVRATTANRVNELGFIENTPYNLLSYSEDFSSWSGSAVVTPNTNIAPNNTLSADKLNSNGVTYNPKSQTLVIPINSTITSSIYIKKTEGEVLYYPGISMVFQAISARVARLILNTTTGTFNLEGVTTIGTSANVISFNDYWKIEFTTTDNGGNNSIQFLVYPALSLDGVTITPLATGSTVFWGVQLVIGSTPKDYFYTSDRLNIPRLNYNVVGGCPSILLEPQRTNLFLRSNEFNLTPWSVAGINICVNKKLILVVMQYW